MFLYSIYKALKVRLSTLNNSPLGDGGIIPVYLFTGQYLPGKDNKSLTIPAIYIELPKNSPINHYPKKVTTSKGNLFKIHYISYAPFANHDSTQQELAIEQHEAVLQQIDNLINQWNLKDVTNKNVSEQFITTDSNLLSFKNMAVSSVLVYKTEVYSRHLS